MFYMFDIPHESRITKNELLKIIKKEAIRIGIKQIMLASIFLREDGKYMQSPYREEYIQRFTKAFLIRTNDLKKDTKKYTGHIDICKLQEFLKTLENHEKEAKTINEACFLKIAGLIATYTTFIREESIHPIGTKFPGGLQLIYENGEYLCPVKEKQEETSSALCKYCASKQQKLE